MRIVVTRPAGQEAELSERLEALGHEVVHCPLVRVEPLGDDPIELAGYDWVVVTSVNGARELVRRASGPLPRVAAVGRATADAVGGADLVPPVSTQEGLVEAFPPAPGRVLFVGAEGARRLLVECLGADFLAAYRTVESVPAVAPRGDLVVVASPSAARALAATGAAIPIVSIGPETTRHAMELGLVVAAEATRHDLDGLVEAVERLDPSS